MVLAATIDFINNPERYNTKQKHKGRGKKTRGNSLQYLGTVGDGDCGEGILEAREERTARRSSWRLAERAFSSSKVALTAESASLSRELS